MIPEPPRRLTNGRLAKATDEELVRKAIAAPEEDTSRSAASELLRRYQDRVYLWCYRYVHDHDRALDLAQDVLLLAYRRLATFRSEARFSSWLFAVTRNRCLSSVRTPGLLIDAEADLDHLPQGERGPDEKLQEKQDEEALLRLIRTELAPLEQEALWLRCFEKLPVDEITRLLHIDAASGARGVLQAARRKLRSALTTRARKRGDG